MQLRQFRALSAAKAAHLFLTQEAPPVVLTQASPGFGTQVARLRSLIDAVEARAIDQDPSTWKNRNAARDAAVRQLRDLSLRSLRQLAHVIVARPSGVTVSAEFPSLIPVPKTSHVEAILQAAHATVQQLAPYQALFVAWGLAPDFLWQLKAETAQVEALADAARDAHHTQLTATRDIARLLDEIRQTLRGLTSALRYLCARDGARGEVTYATWLQLKRPRQAARTTAQTAVPTSAPPVPLTEETSEETSEARTEIRPKQADLSVLTPIQAHVSDANRLRLPIPMGIERQWIAFRSDGYRSVRRSGEWHDPYLCDNISACAIPISWQHSRHVSRSGLYHGGVAVPRSRSAGRPRP